MFIAIPTYRLHAMCGKQQIQLRVPRTELEAVLKVLQFNNVTSLSYVLEDSEQPVWLNIAGPSTISKATGNLVS